MKISSKYKGILYIIISAFGFACMGAFVRLAGPGIPTIQKSFFRNAVAFLIAVVVIIHEKKGIRPNNMKNLPWFFGRAIFGTVGLLANFYAIDHLNLADAGILNKMSPFFAIIASLIFLKEKINYKQVLMLVGAFAGAMFVIKPSFANVNLGPALIGLLGGLTAGLAYTIVRRLGRDGERSSLVVFIFSGFSCLVALPFLIFDYTPMTWQQLLFLIGAGAAAACGQFGITAAYFHAPAREISIYDYSQIIFSTVLGLILFHEIPDVYSFIGYILIIGMAVLNFIYNNKKAKKEELPQAEPSPETK